MKIIQFKGSIKLEYKSQTLRAIYDSAYPDNPFWLNHDLSKLLNINENKLTSQSIPKKYKATIAAIGKLKKITPLECLTTEGLLNLINKRASTPEIEEFLDWLESTAIPFIKEKGSQLANSVVEQAAVEATTIEPGTIILQQHFY